MHYLLARQKIDGGSRRFAAAMAELGRLSRLPPGGEGNLRAVRALIDRHQDDLKLARLRRVQIVCENHLLRRSVELALRPPTRQRYEEFVQLIRGSKHALMSLPGAQAALAAIDSEMRAHRDTIFDVMIPLWKESQEEQKDSRRMAAAAAGRHMEDKMAAASAKLQEMDQRRRDAQTKFVTSLITGVIQIACAVAASFPDQPPPPPVDTSGASAFDQCMQAAGNKRDACKANCNRSHSGDMCRAKCDAAYLRDIARCVA